MKIKNICCIGAGYVGGPTMAVIALKCPEYNITVVDLNEEKIKLWNGDIDTLPVYEPGLNEIISKVRGKNLFFSTDITEAIQKSQMIFMAVNTPTKISGEGAGMAADLKYVKQCALRIAKDSYSDKIVIEKSTLPVRTAETIKTILESNGKENVNFEILSNPEFLAEGTAIQDLFKSDRVLIGGDPSKSGQKAVKSLVKIYENWVPRNKILTTNVWSSELAKLASNAMLAQRISSINSLSAVCQKTEADIEEVADAIGRDRRIGKHFLKSSVGFGGSCFKKDILNLVYLCRHYGLEEVGEYWHGVIKINNYQTRRFSNLIIDNSKGCKEHKISLLGWAFKKDTNDSRESAAIYISLDLLRAGLKINIYDPKIQWGKILFDIKSLMILKGYKKHMIESMLKNVNIENNHTKLLDQSNTIGIITEWDEFKSYDWKSLSKIVSKNCSIIDGRNILDNNMKDYGFNYIRL
jgi:UDPglucose 6-dehydrogenase